MQSIFVSSTFKDMQGERDALHRYVIPQLREKAQQYSQSIQFVDLRWGISTTDMDSDEGAGKILEVCLNEIRQCKPYMIVLLGERYGWMPSPALLQGSAEDNGFTLESYEMSVTELEIQYGMYLAQGQIDRCIFCLREPLPIHKMPKSIQDIYRAENEEDLQRMRKLRNKIRNTSGATVLEYCLDWDKEKETFTGYETFAEALSDLLENRLSGDWKTRQAMSWRERQRDEDALIIKLHQDSFAGREQTLREISEAIDTHQVVILEGEGGCGKSALMAQLVKRYQEKGQAQMFCCGNSNYCVSATQLMKLMWWQLDVQAKQIHWEEPEEAPEFREHFNTRMKNYAGPNVVFFIDAIDQLSPDRSLYESWFVPSNISSRIKLVISTTGAVRVNPMALPQGKQGTSTKILHLMPPEGEDLREILTSRFLAEHKQVSRRVADKILENPCSKNMLGMEIMVRRLVMLNQADFREIAELEQRMSGNEAIDTYLLQLINQMSSDLQQLIIDYTDSVCTFLDKDNIEGNRMPMYIIALMQHGFSADQFERLETFIRTDKGYAAIEEDHFWKNFWDPIRFARMKRYLGSLMHQRTDGRVDYTHRLLREALLSRQGVDNISQILRYWIFFEPQEDISRLENILIIHRFSEDSDIRSKKENYVCDPEMAKTFLHYPIWQSGNLEGDPDPEKAEEGKRQMEILLRSVVTDLGAADGWKHLDTYCIMLESIIKSGKNANYYGVWFFGVPLSNLLEQQGEREKAMAVQILCCLIASLQEQKKAFEAGKAELADNWKIQRKRRMLLYYTRAMRMKADLLDSIQMGTVKTGKTYGMNEDTLFREGIALAEECIAQEPQTVIHYVRKAQLYCYYSSLLREVRWGKKSNQQTKLVEEAMTGVENAIACLQTADAETKINMESLCLHIIGKCIGVLTQVYLTQVVRRRTILDTAEQYFQKGWELFKNSDHKDQLPVQDVAALLLAWRRYCYARSSTLRELLKEKSDYSQVSIDRLYDYYYEIRSKEKELSQQDREALAAIAVEICALAAEGYEPKKRQEEGYGRRSLLRYIIEKEGSYLQAQARSDFVSRWRWAQMVCAQTLYHHEIHPEKCLECGEQALAILNELLEARKKISGIDVSEVEISNESAYVQKLITKSKEQPEKA